MKVSKIILEENSIAGRPPRAFLNQEIEIRHESPIKIVGADGHVSLGYQPSEIFWRGVKSTELENVTDVKVEDSRGENLLNGELIKTYGAPRDKLDGVQFQVLRH
jgi:hypothetical protein